MNKEISIEQSIINKYWEKHRERMLIREELIKYLRENYDTDLKSNSHKEVAVEELKKVLTSDTLIEFCENLNRFGLVKNDIAELLHISNKKVQKLIDEGVIRINGAYISRAASFKIEYHICNLADIIKYYNQNNVKGDKKNENYQQNN